MLARLNPIDFFKYSKKNPKKKSFPPPGKNGARKGYLKIRKIFEIPFFQVQDRFI
jgi:hypothetical protein